jgi:mannose-1-phosphate guanylyltransferase/mannose-6-phosphate isomerase
MSIKDYCIYEGDTIHEAMLAIRKSKTRCVCVLNESQRVIGVISQGDILKLLLDGVNQYSHVKNYAITNFVYLNELDYEKAWKLMRHDLYTLIPVIDKSFRLIEVISISDVYGYLERTYLS